MVKIKNKTGAWVDFGHGTTCVTSKRLSSSKSFAIQLTVCKKTEIGGTPVINRSNKSYVNLLFKNVEGLSILIKHLEALKEEMNEEAKVQD